MLPSQYYHFSQFSVIGVVGSWYVQAGKYYKVLWNLSLCLVYVKSTGMEDTFRWLRIVRGRVWQRRGGGEGIAALCPGWRGWTIHVYILLWQVQLLSSQWVITDALQDSTANAYHTTVPCLSGRLELHIHLHHSNDLYSI